MIRPVLVFLCCAQLANHQVRAYEPAETEKSRIAQTILKHGMPLQKVLEMFGPPDWVVTGQDRGDWAPGGIAIVGVYWRNRHCPPVYIEFDVDTRSVIGRDEGRGGCNDTVNPISGTNLPPDKFKCTVSGQRRYLRKYCGQ